MGAVKVQPRVLLGLACVVAAQAFRLPLKPANLASGSRKDVVSAAAPALGWLLLPKGEARADELAPVGAAAPWVELPVSNVQGKKQLRLEDLSGKWKVLYFYPDDMSASCSLEARKFQAALPAIRSQNAEIIGVSPQGPTDHAQFCSSLGLEFPLVSDSDGVLAKAYGAQQEVPLFGTFTNRETYIIDPKNVIRWKDKNVSLTIDKHADNVLELLREFNQKLEA